MALALFTRDQMIEQIIINIIIALSKDKCLMSLLYLLSLVVL